MICCNCNYIAAEFPSWGLTPSNLASRLYMLDITFHVACPRCCTLQEHPMSRRSLLCRDVSAMASRLSVPELFAKWLPRLVASAERMKYREEEARQDQPDDLIGKVMQELRDTGLRSDFYRRERSRIVVTGTMDGKQSCLSIAKEIEGRLADRCINIGIEIVVILPVTWPESQGRVYIREAWPSA